MSRQRNLFTTISRTGLNILSRTRLPKIDGEIHIAGLQKQVEIIRDARGIPHIYAHNLHDLFFAQGFTHAQERLWQMEFVRRMVSGRLAAILGPVALPLDRWMRTLTMRRVAESEVNLLDDSVRSNLQAYANGINTCIARGRLPIEFTLLRCHPDPWIVADTLSWIKMMSWTLSVNWEAEILRSLLIARLGAEMAAELEVQHLMRWPYIVPPESDYSYIGASALERARQARPFSGPSPYEGLGSNNWALSGSRTATGSPILANDMHLGLTAPAIWYENHLSCPELDLYGVTFPGVPGIVSGHNGHVAWGFTNGFPDVQDLFMERLRRSDNEEIEVEYNGNWEPAHIIKETIEVKDQASVIEEVVITRHGPIINSLSPDFAGEQPLALQWTSLEPDTMAHAIFAMMSAQDCQEFKNALQEWTAPVQNVVYADTSGNIGYSFPGKIPLRARGNGRIPAPGWTSEYEWIGYIPFDALPHMLNPHQGFIATANNRAVSEDYPINIDLEPISGDRAQRICELILDPASRGGREKIAIEDVKHMQFDQVSPSSRIITRYINSLSTASSAHTPESRLQAALKLFSGWDGTLSSESAPGALYQVFIRNMIRRLLSHRLDDRPKSSKKQNPNPENISTTDRFMGKGPTPVLAETGLFGERWLAWLINLLPDADSQWFDLGQGETRDDVMLLAFQESVNDLTKLLGPDIRSWKWGDIHQVTFRHTLGSNPILGELFNIGPRPVGGDHTTVWQTGTSYHDLDSSAMVGPPYRMIIDLGNLDNSVSMLVPGQSGHPASPYYADQVENWFSGNYHPMLYTRQRVIQGARHTLRIQP